MKRYTIRRIDGHWTLFNGTGPIAHAKTIKELQRIAGLFDVNSTVGCSVEVCGRRGKA